VIIEVAKDAGAPRRPSHILRHLAALFLERLRLSRRLDDNAAEARELCRELDRQSAGAGGSSILIRDAADYLPAVPPSTVPRDLSATIVRDYRDPAGQGQLDVLFGLLTPSIDLDDVARAEAEGGGA
jgi:hypothetical protein